MMPDRPVGGGEVLEYWGQNPERNEYQWLDGNLIRQFEALGWIRYLIFAILIALAILFILRLFQIKPNRRKGLVSELEYMGKLKKRDKKIIATNKLIRQITSFMEKTWFSMPKGNVEYWQYNLRRAGIKIPGGARDLTAQEFHAILQAIQAALVLVIGPISFLINPMMGLMLVVIILIVGSTIPIQVIRARVAAKDLEIKKNFCDYYLMIHYVLLASSNTPLSGVMRSYAKTTESEEMVRFVDTCISYMETHGEYEATNFIAKDYREVAMVGKLMRLIRQANEGGEVKAELIGFRDELLAERKFAIARQMDKLVSKAKFSFNMLLIILVQAIISAIGIYLSDLGSSFSMFGI
jgi:hypothetical protein